MYATIDKESQGFASNFRAEAERLWLTERHRDTVLNMATAQFLSLAYIGQGRDHAVLTYLAEASNMGTRMGLFGVEIGDESRFAELTPSVRSAYKYASWGVFNWIMQAIPTARNMLGSCADRPQDSCRFSTINLAWYAQNTRRSFRHLETKDWSSKVVGPRSIKPSNRRDQCRSTWAGRSRISAIFGTFYTKLLWSTTEMQKGHLAPMLMLLLPSSSFENY